MSAPDDLTVEALPNRAIAPSGYRLAQDQLGILRLLVRDGITGHWYVLPTANIRYDATKGTDHASK